MYCQMQALDDPEEIKSTTYKILNDNLKNNVKLALDSVLSIRKDGKQYYNTIKYHGTTAVDDVQLIQVLDQEPQTACDVLFTISLVIGLVHQ